MIALTLSTFTLFVWGGGQASGRSSEHHARYSASPDSLIPEEQALWTTKSRSVPECARDCISSENGRAFTFTPTTATCTCHSSALTSSGTDLTQGATKVYVVVFDDDTIVSSSWLNKSCTSDSDCAIEHSLCFDGRGVTTCLCRFGYYYSHSQDKCLAECGQSTLQQEFVMYPGSVIVGYNQYVYYKITRLSCLSICAQNPQCLTVEYDFTVTGTCCVQYVTALDVPGSAVRYGVVSYDFYQKMCV